MFWNKKVTVKVFNQFVTSLQEEVNNYTDKTNKQVANYAERTCALEKRCLNLEEKLIKLRPCKDVELNHRLPSDPYSIRDVCNALRNSIAGSKGKYSPYSKKCKLCEKEEYITKKQYLTYQKETIESSLKECE
jgi:hypothetical protein